MTDEAIKKILFNNINKIDDIFSFIKKFNGIILYNDHKIIFRASRYYLLIKKYNNHYYLEKGKIQINSKEKIDETHLAISKEVLKMANDQLNHIFRKIISNNKVILDDITKYYMIQINNKKR